MTSSNTQVPPRISIITPSYNQAKYLEQCIRSVLEQNYPHIEYMIIDGGSSDESQGIIHKYADKLAFWVSEPDRGQSDALNKGFRRASGDLVAWLNADDFYLPNALESAAEAYLRDPNASFYFGNGWRVDENGDYKSDYFPHDGVTFNRKALIHALNFILQPATFIRRAALEQAGYLDSQLHYALDTDLWIRLSALADPVPVQAFLAASREYAQAKSSKGSFERLEELRRVAEKHSGLPVTPGYLCYFLDTLHRFTRQHEEIYPPAYRKDLETFWAATAQMMQAYGVRPDGVPVTDQQPSELPNRTFASLPQVSLGKKFLRKLYHLIGRFAALE
jgi:glycosyltransferase involved in cell wall biosynthesis